MENMLVFRLILLLLLVGFVAHRAYYTRKFPPKEEETLTKMSAGTLSKLANILSVVALLSSLIYIVYPSLISWAIAPFPTWIRWSGLIIALAGFGILEWSHRALAANWSDQPRLMNNQVLVKTGPYQWVRHPIYTAFLLILGSSLLTTANWLVGLAWLSSVIIDIRERVVFEEGVMQKRFGQEYEIYRLKSGRLFPKFNKDA